jgi:hypothetical protein
MRHGVRRRDPRENSQTSTAFTSPGGGRKTYDLERRLGRCARRDRNTEAWRGELCFGHLDHGSSQLLDPIASRSAALKLPAGYSTRELNQVAEQSVFTRRPGVLRVAGRAAWFQGEGGTHEASTRCGDWRGGISWISPL